MAPPPDEALRRKTMETMTGLTAEQEQEARAADEIREQAASLGSNRRIHPGLMGWLAQRERLFASNVRGDLANAPERHPDVQLLKRLLPQSSFALHVRMAWLCWRARQVRFFSPDCGSRSHVGEDVMTWAEALESADERDSIHDAAFEARANYYANRPTREQQRDAARAEEEAVALTLMRLHTPARTSADVDIAPVADTGTHAEAVAQMEQARGTDPEETEAAKNKHPGVLRRRAARKYGEKA
jgi:hypothetical protein